MANHASKKSSPAKANDLLSKIDYDFGLFECDFDSITNPTPHSINAVSNDIDGSFSPSTYERRLQRQSSVFLLVIMLCGEVTVEGVSSTETVIHIYIYIYITMTTTSLPELIVLQRRQRLRCISKAASQEMLAQTES